MNVLVSDMGGCKHSLRLGEKGRLIVSWSIVRSFEEKLLQGCIYTSKLFFFPWIHVKVMLAVLVVAGRMLKGETAGRKSEVEWVTVWLLNVSQPGRGRKGAADSCGLGKQNFPWGLKGSTGWHCMSSSHCEGEHCEPFESITLFLILLAG